MILLDSNVVIYSTEASSEFDELRKYLLTQPHCVSLVTYVEVLGFHKLNDLDKEKLSEFFASVPVLSLTDEIAAQAVKLKQTRKMKLGDSIIAATALINEVPLVTNNTKDFKWIDSLDLIDPFDAQ